MIRTAEQVFPEAIFAASGPWYGRSLLRLHRERLLYSATIDASHEPLAKNIEITRRIAGPGPRQRDRCRGGAGPTRRRRGCDGSVCLTNPAEAVEFVAKSGCDSLAVAIGTSHGAYKFAGAQGLRMDRLAESPKGPAQGLPHGYARLLQRAQGMGRSGKCGGGKMRIPAACPRTSTFPRPSWASAR